MKAIIELSHMVRAIGVVFGDIGTSPLYTLSAIILIAKPSKEDIIGIVSLIIWSLILIPTIQYAWFAMKVSTKGEGGIIVLGEYASSISKSLKLRRVIRILTILGIGFLLGDGIITPAITILSSVEGLRLIKGLESLSQDMVIVIAFIIALFLFAVQRYGTGNIGIAFGPIMVIYFSTIAVIGLYYIYENPNALRVINPAEAISFILKHPFIAILSLSEIILAVTGSEAMYADMGHVGKNAIRIAWGFVFISVSLSYIGQCGFILEKSLEGHINPFFYSANELLGNNIYILFLILVTVAGIIASQALISGVFSLVFQSINSGLMPLLYVKHTSTHFSTQIYIPVVNFLLFVGVSTMFLVFKQSERMASAYGFAVNMNMVITAMLLMYIFLILRKIPFFLGSIGLFIVDTLFLFSGIFKIPHGAYWAIIFAIPPILLIFLYTSGQRRIYEKSKFMDLEKFLEVFNKVYSKGRVLKGTAVFLIKDVRKIPPYVVTSVINHGILYEQDVFLSLKKLEKPFGINVTFCEDLDLHIKHVVIEYGYQEIVNLDKELKKLNINERVIFYGVDNIYSHGLVWKLFGLIKKVSPNFADFYRLLPQKVHGVVVRIEI